MPARPMELSSAAGAGDWASVSDAPAPEVWLLRLAADVLPVPVLLRLAVFGDEASEGDAAWWPAAGEGYSAPAVAGAAAGTELRMSISSMVSLSILNTMSLMRAVSQL